MVHVASTVSTSVCAVGSGIGAGTPKRAKRSTIVSMYLLLPSVVGSDIFATKYIDCKNGSGGEVGTGFSPARLRFVRLWYLAQLGLV